MKPCSGQESGGPCYHNNDSVAVRLCNVEGQWEAPDLSACNSKKSQDIKKVAVGCTLVKYQIQLLFDFNLGYWL